MGTGLLIREEEVTTAEVRWSGEAQEGNSDPEPVVPSWVPSVILGAGVTRISVVESEDSRVPVVLLQLGCEEVEGSKLVSTTLVVSARTGVLRDAELVAEERRVPETVGGFGEGEVLSAEGRKEGVWVPQTVKDFIRDTPSDTMLRRVGISEDVKS